MNRQFAEEELQISTNRWWNVNKKTVNLIYNKRNAHEQSDTKIFAHLLDKKKKRWGMISNVEDAIKNQAFLFNVEEI